MTRSWVLIFALVACSADDPSAATSGAGAGGGAAGGMGGGSATAVDLGGGVSVAPAELTPGGEATITYRGALADSAALTLHYGFDGWNELAGVASTSEDDGTGNHDFHLEAAMEAIDGGFRITVGLPAEARALHAVFRAGEGGGATWDNHDGDDYGVGVLFPYAGPYLTYSGTLDPAHEVVVSFQTGFLCHGRVEHGADDGLGSVVEEEAGERAIHHVRLAGLPAEGEVHYRVACGPRSSAIHRFRTAGQGLESFAFAVLGDMQDDGEEGRWAEVAAEIAQRDVAFVAITGDMPWNDRPGLWWSFFDAGRALFATKPMLPAVGNHDTPGTGSSPDTSDFERVFGLSPAYYRFRYGHAAFVVLASERPEDFVQGSGVQHAFAADEVALAAPATWVFASWHIPPYNAGKRHFGEQGSFRDVTALFDGTVDWVLCGHEHLYQRMLPLRYNGVIAPSGVYGRGASDGVGYLVVPPAGVFPGTELIPHDDPTAYYRDRLAYPSVAPPNDVAPSEVGFLVVTLAGKAFSLEAVGMGDIDAPAAPHVVDQVAYSRP